MDAPIAPLAVHYSAACTAVNDAATCRPRKTP